MTLIERLERAKIYDLGNGKRQLVTGGDIEHWAKPFDGGDCAPWNLLWSERVVQGNWGWMGKGTQGYLVKPSTGTVRVYPVRGDQTKYIQISGLADKNCTVNQIDNKNLEIYLDQEFTRWSLKMGPDGFKPEIILKSGYSGDGVFQFRFELNGGLELEGAWIMDGGTRVLKMHNPFSIDAEGTQRAVTESLADGIVTLTADLDGFVYPGIVDPTLGPIQVTRDTYLRSRNPTTGHGQEGAVFVGNENEESRKQRGLWLWDVSAILSGATVISADMSLVVVGTRALPQNFEMNRCTRTDWEDAGVFTPDAEANWNNYKDPNVAWTSPGGDYETGVQDTYTATALAGQTEVISIINNIADAVSNRGGISSMVHKRVVEDGVNNSTEYVSKEGATPPTLTVVYEEAGGQEVLMGGGLLNSSVLNGGGFGNQGGYGL